MDPIQNGTLYDCKPWETGILFNNTNLLNSFKQNLYCYEQGFRKFTIKSRCELPQIQKCAKSRAIASDNKIEGLERIATINKSTEIPKIPSKHKQSNCTLAKQMREDDISNKQNKQSCTERQRYKQDFKTKIFLFNFEEQNKYKRMKKREIHQVVFGDRSKHRRSRESFQ